MYGDGSLEITNFNQKTETCVEDKDLSGLRGFYFLVNLKTAGVCTATDIFSAEEEEVQR